MARLEAVVRRLFPDRTIEPWLPGAGPRKESSEKKRPRRSRLYLPGNEPKFMLNAPLHNPDALILDLEDSVAPSEKDAARVLVRNALVHLNFQGCEAMVRINQGEMGLEDLAFLVPHGVQLVLIPKVEDEGQVRAVADEIERLSKEHGREEPVWLMPIIESAKGAWFGYEIASAHDTVVSLAIGLEDYTADIGAQRTNEGRESFWARSQVVNAARAAGVQPIDTVFSDVSDMDGLLASVLEAKSLGFEGKGCIHPRQIEVVHHGFAPAGDEIEKAKKIVLAFEEADRQGLGVVSLGSKMIDPPVVKRALRTVSLAEMDGLLPADWREWESE
jgi:citrate lyase subunit beta/citryl-CoA lyase